MPHPIIYLESHPISIPELLENGAELDLYYTEPKTIGELLA